jgi:hypothetical protein
MLWLRRYNLLFLKHFVTLARKYHQYRGARLINERWLVANSCAGLRWTAYNRDEGR